MKNNNKENGSLPKNIDQIINGSLKTININVLIKWLIKNKVRFKVIGTGAYQVPTYKEVKIMLKEIIKSYYLANQTNNEITVALDIDKGFQPSMGNVVLTKMKGGSPRFGIEFIFYPLEDQEKMFGANPTK